MEVRKKYYFSQFDYPFDYFFEDYLKRKCTTCNNFWNKRKYEIGETTCAGLGTHTYREFYYDCSVNEVIEILKKCQKVNSKIKMIEMLSNS